MAWNPTRRQFVVLTGAATLSIPLAARGQIGRHMRVVNNPYENVDWQADTHYKAALHLHTLQSDGYHRPDTVIQAYRRAGYSIMALTDHDWFGPNGQVNAGNVPEEEGSPYPGEPRPANYPANPTWPWTDFGSQAPEDMGMVGIQANEITGPQHINSYFNDFGLYREEGLMDAEGRFYREDEM